MSHELVSYVFRRLLLMVPLFFGITLISFFILHLAPGEPTDMQTMLNPKASAEATERLREIYGLDKPIIVQYIDWLKRLVVLDFGTSFSPDARPVFDKFMERIPVTLFINIASFILIVLVAVPLGILSATHRNSLFDRAVTLFVFLGFSTPGFWLALLLMIFFGINLGILPISGIRSFDYDELTTLGKIQDQASHLILPVFVSAFGGLAGFSRFMRSTMLEVIAQNFITTARAKGLSEFKVIYKHAFRNAVLPLITLFGLALPGFIGGSVIFETIFAIPGMGQLFYASVMARDYPMVMGGLVIGAFLTLLGNLLADVGYALADPRISYKNGR